MQVFYRGDNVENERAINVIKDIRLVRVVFTDSKKRVWIKAWSRESPFYNVYSFSEDANELTHFSLKDQVKSTHDVNGFLETSNGSIWIRGFRTLAEFDERAKKFKVEPSGIIKSIQDRAVQLDADLDIEANHKGVSITLITPAQLPASHK